MKGRGGERGRKGGKEDGREGWEEEEGRGTMEIARSS